MARFEHRLSPDRQATAIRAIYALPPRVRRMIAGPPIRLDNQELALDAQLLLRLRQLARTPELSTGTPEQARAAVAASSILMRGTPIEPVGTREVTIPVRDGSIGARLYVPDGLPDDSALLVFLHGGGFVICTLDTHDALCRFLAREAGIRVLSVDYRLAPEHRFPVAVEDALAAFRYAHANAEELGADPERIGIGGDSAGGNLSGAVAQLTTRADGPKPVFQMLLYPVTDGTRRTRSRELFKDGFFLTTADMTWFNEHYTPDPASREDPRFSLLLAEDLTGLPPAYVATAGFDPLRDEGEAYAARMAEAGVPVALTRHADLIHGYATFLGVGTRFREAVFEGIGALRTGLRVKPAESVRPAPA